MASQDHIRNAVEWEWNLIRLAALTAAGSIPTGQPGKAECLCCGLPDQSRRPHGRATTRWAGAIIGLVCAIILFSGADVGSIVPKVIIGGMLAYLGAVIIVEPLNDARTWS